MKKDKKILITSVYNLLCQSDPEWQIPYMKEVQFQALYDAWSTSDRKKGYHTNFFYSSSWERGWLPQADFRRWRRYAMQ